jgi:hypothetical protein
MAAVDMTGQDADADAGPKTPKRGEAGANHFHF